MSRERVDVAEIARACGQLVAERAESAQMALVYDLPERGAATVQADRTKIMHLNTVASPYVPAAAETVSRSPWPTPALA